ncbi:hypothetical protein, conserved [Candida dubliniensis CD36]|uniref:Uncharacterized protein n=1 Tax=Candida dubliniensis (strain CD36 / ATCC MYA-646 / CBS 7987 / NCPF 3949 / NRRL Y-17841) TaxID=573826 RepID=B9W8A7_CANDC|nr:hypothetical protein, conserved [Candida dubliniensis CD36]CAX44963.1 hypothetical protein, conserved [Candida dubliniensis CD36]
MAMKIKSKKKKKKFCAKTESKKKNPNIAFFAKIIFDIISLHYTHYQSSRIIMPLTCPLCQTELRLHLLQPELSIISCPSLTCIYPFNLSVDEIHSKSLLVPMTNDDIMNKMKQKFKNTTNITEDTSRFIAGEES